MYLSSYFVHVLWETHKNRCLRKKKSNLLFLSALVRQKIMCSDVLRTSDCQTFKQHGFTEQKTLNLVWKFHDSNHISKHPTLRTHAKLARWSNVPTRKLHKSTAYGNSCSSNGNVNKKRKWWKIKLLRGRLVTRESCCNFECKSQEKPPKRGIVICFQVSWTALPYWRFLLQSSKLQPTSQVGCSAQEQSSVKKGSHGQAKRTRWSKISNELKILRCPILMLPQA